MDLSECQESMTSFLSKANMTFERKEVDYLNTKSSLVACNSISISDRNIKSGFPKQQIIDFSYGLSRVNTSVVYGSRSTIFLI